MPIRSFLIVVAASLCVSAMPAFSARSDEVLVAVASNFAVAAERLEVDFEAATGHGLELVSGSTGKLYAQIVSGAPFEVLLAADQRRPDQLVSDGLANAETRRTYAIGRLVLWSADPDGVAADGRTTLREGKFRRLALANPDLAPYGFAARQVLGALDLEERLAPRLVMGENIGQTHALVATGNAEIGFIAAAQQARLTGARAGRGWLVPQDLHDPIRQDVVLLARGADSDAAQAFVDYLASARAKRLIESFGYGVE